MSIVKIQGNASGTGEFTLASPNGNTNRTITLPDATGTLDRTNRAGNVLQVVQATTTSMTTVTAVNTNTDTALTSSITPTSSSSNVLVIISLPFILAASTSTAYCGFGLKRNSTTIYAPSSDATGSFNYGAQVGSSTSIQHDGVFNLQFLDSPSSTSAVSYTVFVNLYTTTSASVRTPYNAGAAIQTGVITLMEIAA